MKLAESFHFPRFIAVFALALSLCGARGRAEGPSLDVRASLESDLVSSLHNIKKHAADLAAGKSGAWDDLRAAAEKLRDAHLLMTAVHEERGLALAETPRALRDRQSAMSSLYRKEMKGILDRLAALEALSPDKRPAAAKDLASFLDKKAPRPDRRPLAVQLPTRQTLWPLRRPEPLGAPRITPAYMDPALPAPLPADEAPTPDAPFAPEIMAKAQELGRDPVRIFRFVQSSIDVEFYHGFMKGAVETLRQRAGNDADQASLLIALLRASGVPARYVRGVASMPQDQVLDWMGLPGVSIAEGFFARAGIPAEHLFVARPYFRVSRVWAEAYVPYKNYRGAAVDRDGKVWVPLDPALKSRNYFLGRDFLEDMGFTARGWVDEYLSVTRSTSPLAFYERKISDFLAASHPELNLEQALGNALPIEGGRAGVLPASTPYDAQPLEESPVPFEALRHKARLTAQGEDGVSFDAVVPVSELLNRRVTVSYVPASVEDHIAVNMRFSLDQTPAYLVKVRPVLMRDGLPLAAGRTAVPMGSLHTLRVELQAPGGAVSFENELTAGGYYALAVGGVGETPRTSPEALPGDTEREAAARLYAVGAEYLSRWTAADRRIADILRVVPIRPTASAVMTGNAYNRSVLFGRPQAIDWKGVFVDADLRVANPMSFMGALPRNADFMALSALQGSWLEGAVLEEQMETDAVSAAKLIALARETGVPVENLTAANVESVLASLPVDDLVKEDLRAAVGRGWETQVPGAELTRNAWTGTGYILRDPATGGSGYFISGGLAGGHTSMTPEQWVNRELRRIFHHPYTAPPNTNPADVVKLQIVPVTNHQEGTVGLPTPQDIAVWAQDSAGRPVQGATVTFSVMGGGATLAGGASATAVTDALGLAKIRPTLGTSTNVLPFYLKSSTETHPTRAGQNVILAQAGGHRGTVYTPVPFQLFARPDAPHHLVKVLGDNAVAIAGTAAGTLRVRLEDQHNNPISNAIVTFTVQGQTLIDGGPMPAAARNMVVYEQPCAVKDPLLGDCNGADITFIDTSVYGAAVDTILGNTVRTQFQVLVESDGVPSQTFSPRSTGFRTYASNTYLDPELLMVALQSVNDRGEVLSAAKVGEAMAAPFRVRIFKGLDQFTIEPTGDPACGTGPSDPYCWRLVTQEVINPLPVVDGMNSESLIVSFTPTAGGGSAGTTANLGAGVYASTLTVGGSPALNHVDSFAQGTVTVPHINLRLGSMTMIPVPMAVGNKIHVREDGTYYYVWTDTYTLPHEAYGVLLTLPENGVEVDASSATVTDRLFSAVVLPLAYHPAQTEFNVYKTASPADEWLGFMAATDGPPLTPGLGVFGATAFRGSDLFKMDEQYALEFILNRGSSAELKSDKKPLHVVNVEPKDVVFSVGESRTAVARSNTGDATVVWVGDAHATATGSPADPSTGTVTATGVQGEGTVRAVFSWPSGFAIPAELTTRVGEIDLDIHRPAVIDVAESTVPQHLELTQGAQTFVNLDNDDRDGIFDLNDDNVTGGGVTADNELVKLDLKIGPTTYFTTGKVFLDVHQGKEKIKLWRQADKTTAHVAGSTYTIPTDFTAVDGNWVKNLWVEGIAQSTVTQQTKMKLRYDGLPRDEDEVALTVVGIATVTWVGRGNSVNDDNLLDADINHPSGLLPTALRVFSESRVVAGVVETSTRNAVDVRVELSVQPVEPLPIRFRAFDVDDSSATALPLDNPAAADDNFGTWPAQTGILRAGAVTAPAGGVLTSTFSVQSSTVEFQTTIQPGDNFRVVAGGDPAFLAALHNNDTLLGTNAADLLRIVDPAVTGTFAQQEVRESTRCVTPVLTVWRTLHVEVDSMAAVSSNTVTGSITAWTAAPSNNVTLTNMQAGGAALTSLVDGSGGAGRFAQGTLIASGPFFNVRTNTTNVLNITGGFTESFSVSSGALTTAGNIVAYAHPLATVSVPLVPGAFAGGTLTVPGAPALTVLANTANTLTLGAAALNLPFTLVDDDGWADGMKVPRPDVSGLPAAFAPAYVRISTEPDNDNVPFFLNAVGALTTSYDFDNLSRESDRYWQIYVLGAHQRGFTDDGDPITESFTFGEVNAVNAVAGGGSIAGTGQGAHQFIEAIDDFAASASCTNPALNIFNRPSSIMIHEVGHLFGGTHGPLPTATTLGFPFDGGAMDNPCTRTTDEFAPLTLQKIRSIPHP